jgi:3-hydroxyacyl-CoA dehydrogenase
MARERELFLECLANSQAKALQYVFFAERKAGNVPNLDKAVARREIKGVAVIGAGTMGGGIAMNFPERGHTGGAAGNVARGVGSGYRRDTP